MALPFSGRRRNENEPASASAAEETDVPRWMQEIVVYGCHGGAATTTLAELLGVAWDIGSYRQVRTDVGTYGRPLVVSCRDSVNASARVSDTLGFLAEIDVRPAALVIVAEGAGPEPEEATMRFRLAEPGVRGVVRFPFVPGLRYVDTDQARKVDLPKKAQAALGRIKQLCLADAQSTLAERRRVTVGAN